MQEQIFCEGTSAPQQQQASRTLSQMLRSTQQQRAPASQTMQQQKHLQQTTIITPTKSAHYELLAVKEVFFQVEEAFKTRVLEKKKFQDQIVEKENQIRYCEEETRKQAEAISVLAASNSFRNHKISLLREDINQFNDDQVDPLRDRCEDMKEKFSAGDEIVAALDMDLAPLRLLARQQRAIAAVLSSELAATIVAEQHEIKVLDELVSLKATLDARLKKQDVEMEILVEKRQHVDQDYSKAEQHFHVVQIKDDELKKALREAEERLVQQETNYSEGQVAFQREICQAKVAVAASETKERDIQREADELNIKLVSWKANQVSVNAQVKAAALAKEVTRKRNNDTNERISVHVLERKRILGLMQEAKVAGDDLKGKVVEARDKLQETTERAKEFEKNMQESYSLMGLKMTEQYELQKLEPALRCELYQQQEALAKKIRDSEKATEAAGLHADDAENKALLKEKEVAEKFEELRLLECGLVEEEQELQRLREMTEGLVKKSAQLSTEEEKGKADLENYQSQAQSIEAEEGNLRTLKESLVEKKKAVDHQRHQNELVEGRISLEQTMLKKGVRAWEPSEPLKARVEAAFETENLAMMETLEADCRAKEAEFKAHTTKLKEGFPVPAVWGEKASNIRARIIEEEKRNSTTTQEIEVAVTNISSASKERSEKEEENRYLKQQIQEIIATTAALTVTSHRHGEIIPTEKEEQISQRNFLDDLNEGGDLDLNDDNNVFSQSYLTLTQQNKDQNRKHAQGSEIVNSQKIRTQRTLQSKQQDGYRQSQQGYSSQRDVERKNSQVENRAGAETQNRLKIITGKPLVTSSQSNTQRELTQNENPSQRYQHHSLVLKDVPDRNESQTSTVFGRNRRENESDRTRQAEDKQKRVAEQQRSRNQLPLNDVNFSDDDDEDDNKGKENDESGWMTESSTCFEDTLFGESPKIASAALPEKLPYRKSASVTAAFVPFGGKSRSLEIAASDTYRDFMSSRNEPNRDIAKESVAPTSVAPSAPVPVAPTSTAPASRNGKRKLHPAASASQNLEPMKNYSLSQRVEEEDNEDVIAEDVTTTKQPQKTQRLSAPPHGAVANNKHPVTEGNRGAALMSPPVTTFQRRVPPAPAPSATATSTAVTSTSKPQQTRKPLSSVGLSGIKSSTGNANKDTAGTDMKGIRKPPVPGQGQHNKGGATNAARQQGQSNNSVSAIGQAADGARKINATAKPKKPVSTDDWFDDDDRF